MRVVGISQKIKRAWLDLVLDLLAETTDEKRLRSLLDTHLRQELPGTESRAKAAGIVLRIWSRIDPKYLSFRNRAVAMLPRISGRERIWLHWGMTALAYPFFRDLVEVIGRMLTLQDDFTTAQVQSRLTTTWGDRATSKEAAQKLITSLVDWDVLRATKNKGHFLLARKTTTTVTDLQLWLLEALLSASASDEIEAQQLLRLPESFPFTFTASISDLRKHSGFNIHRQGLDMDMVAVHQVKMAPPPMAVAKAKTPKKKASLKQDQPTFFDDPSPALVSGSLIATPVAPAIVMLEEDVAAAKRTAYNPPTSILLSERGFDFTFPNVPLSGQERSIADLTQPDERSVGYRLDVETLQAPYLAVEKRLPATTPPKLRERIVVARNLAVYGFFCYEFNAVSLFWAVSCIEMALKQKFEEVNPGPFEMRRRLDSEEKRCRVALTELEDKLHMKWRIADLPYFDYSFKALLMWAFRQSVLSDDIEIPVQEIVNSYNNRFALKIFPKIAKKERLLNDENPTPDEVNACWDGLTERQRKHYQAKSSTVLIEELPRFRNIMAHPQRFSLVTPPRSPLSAYQLLIDVVSRLWPVRRKDECTKL